MYMASRLANKKDDVVLDNQAASNCATHAPYHEACDVDVQIPPSKYHRKILAGLMGSKAPRHPTGKAATGVG